MAMTEWPVGKTVRYGVGDDDIGMIISPTELGRCRVMRKDGTEFETHMFTVVEGPAPVTEQPRP